jgi:predicted XRE-type DNA-binding protein
MKFPNQKEINKALKELEEVEPTLVIDYSSASNSDVVKYKLCQEFTKLIKVEGITQVELSKRLGVDKAIVNKIILHKIEHFTIDRLLDLLSKVSPVTISLEAS